MVAFFRQGDIIDSISNDIIQLLNNLEFIYIPKCLLNEQYTGNTEVSMALKAGGSGTLTGYQSRKKC
jgi:hypothetical protein